MEADRCQLQHTHVRSEHNPNSGWSDPFLARGSTDPKDLRSGGFSKFLGNPHRARLIVSSLMPTSVSDFAPNKFQFWVKCAKTAGGLIFALAAVAILWSVFVGSATTKIVASVESVESVESVGSAAVGEVPNPRVDTNALDPNMVASINKIVALEGEGDVLKLENEVHRAMNHYCIPQLTTKLNRDSLETLNFHLLELAQFINNGGDFHNMSDLGVTSYGGLVDPNDAPLEEVSKCPLVTAMFALGKSHETRHHVQETEKSARAVLAQKVGSEELEGVIEEVKRLFTDGPCTDASRNMPLSSLKELVLHALTAVHKREGEGREARGDARFFYDAKGDVFQVESEGQLQQLPKNLDHCADFDAFVGRGHAWPSGITLRAINHIIHERFDKLAHLSGEGEGEGSDAETNKQQDITLESAEDVEESTIVTLAKALERERGLRKQLERKLESK